MHCESLGACPGAFSELILCTCSYAAPENLKCHFASLTKRPIQGYDALKSDVWSVGVVLFVLLHGYTPWDIARDASPDFRLYKHTEVGWWMVNGGCFPPMVSSAFSLLRSPRLLLIGHVVGLSKCPPLEPNGHRVSHPFPPVSCLTILLQRVSASLGMILALLAFLLTTWCTGCCASPRQSAGPFNW
jgi:serine/threonine protein kinase